MAQERRAVKFIGDVQGVGFRYTAMRLAQGFDVAGYVRNLPDGGVEIVVEGEPEQIDSFLESVAERMSPFINHQTQTTSPATGQFTSFTIKP